MALAPGRLRIQRRFSDLPISRKLTVIMTVSTAAALLFSGIGVISFDSVLYREYLRRDLSALAGVVSDNSTAALAFEDASSARETLSALRAKTHVVAACIYRPNGTTLARYIRSRSVAMCPPAREHDGIQTTGDGLSLSHGILLKGRRIGTLILLYDLAEIHERIKIYGLAVFGVLIAASLLAFLLSSKLHGLIADPISELLQTAIAVSRTNDYNIRSPESSDQDLNLLGKAFNQMLEGIQSRDVELRAALLAQENALSDAQNARDFLATTLASIGDAVIATDVGGSIVLANRAAQLLLRRAESEVVGKHLNDVFQVVDEFSREKIDRLLTRVLREGAIIGPSNHTILLAEDGTETPIDDSGAPIRGKTGLVQGIVLVFRDVSARRRADETARLLASIVQSSDDAIIGHDLAGAITSWNKGAERIFGYSAQEMIGQSTAALAPPAEDEMPKVLERVRNGERVEQYYAVRRTKAGGDINVSITVSPLHDGVGRIVGASKIARDVTQQVHAAEQLARLNADLRRSNENLSRSNEDLERFAFIASHDFQEPLRMISIYSQLLIKSYAGQMDTKASAYVDNIVNGTQRLRDLLADLLAYTEVGVAKEESTRIVDLNSVVQKVEANLAAAIDESGAVLIAPTLPSVRAHEGHFIALFQNLVGNAIKYRGQEIPRIEISARSVGDHFLFAVADNGMGIEPEYHEKIFVAFKRLHGKQIPGTGIGLAICQRVVERYGGRIWVESQIGRGATFLFTLPIQICVPNESYE